MTTLTWQFLVAVGIGCALGWIIRGRRLWLPRLQLWVWGLRVRHGDLKPVRVFPPEPPTAANRLRAWLRARRLAKGGRHASR